MAPIKNYWKRWYPSFSGLHLPFFNRLQSVGAALAAQHELMCG